MSTIRRRFLSALVTAGAATLLLVHSWPEAAKAAGPVECPLCVLPEPDGVPKSRFISFVPPAAEANAAIRVRMVTMYVSPYLPRPKDLPDLSAFEGEVRWVGPPRSLPESEGDDPNRFAGAELQCTPYFTSWAQTMTTLSQDVLHVYGTAIVPSSVYEVQAVDESCVDLADEGCYSEALSIGTGIWGDVSAPYGFGSPTFGDWAALLYKFVGNSVNSYGPLTKPSTLTYHNYPRVEEPVTFLDMEGVFDSWTGKPYPFRGPDVCPAAGPVCGDGWIEGDEECDDGDRVAGDGCDENGLAEHRTAVLALMPVDSTGTFAIHDHTVFIEPGDQRVTFEVSVSNWDPDRDGVPILRTYQARIDPAGFVSGLRGVVALAGEPCTTSEQCQSFVGFDGVCQDGQCSLTVMNTEWTDFLAARFVEGLFLTRVDMSLVGPRFAVTVVASQEGVPDDSTERYAGTLVLDTPADAAGTFKIGFDGGPTDTFLRTFETPSKPIPIAALEPAYITIDTGCCFGEGSCVPDDHFSCEAAGGRPVPLCVGAETSGLLEVALLVDQLTGPEADILCSPSDTDGDLDVDLHDFSDQQNAFHGPG